MKKRNLILSVLAVMIVFGLTLFAVPLGVRHLPLDMTAKSCLVEVIGGLLAIAALFILKKGEVLKLRTDGFKEGMASGVFFLVMSGLCFFQFIFNGKPVTLPAVDIVLFSINMLFVGIMEEVLFRGILQEAFHDFFGCDSYKNVLKGILCSAVVFGLAHYLNLIAGVSFKAVTIQVISVIIMGVLFGAVYYRANRNIWVTIILHALVDAGTFIMSGALSGVSEADSIGQYSFGKFVFFPLYIIVTVWILRKNKIRTEAISEPKTI
ncbi:MAG: CPBP family intramembrane metalloprotease [Clostridiales bacterium]|nr:CPBP family intramembrane metalloprotease [Clostridiales bacterium]